MPARAWLAAPGSPGVRLIHAPAGVLTHAGGVLAHAGGHTAGQNFVETLFLIGSVGLGVRLRVTGARIVTQTSAQLSPGKGHIHLYLDGELAAMAYTTVTTIDGIPGRHLLKAEFVCPWP